MKKGISVVTLGIVLVVLNIILGVVVLNSKSYLDETKKTKFVTDYMLVEMAIQKYYDEFQAYPIKLQNGSEAIITLYAKSNSDMSQFGDDYNNAISGIELKVINVSALGYDDLTTGSGKSQLDYYGISDAGNLYYVKGMKYKDKMYYMVTDDLK